MKLHVLYRVAFCSQLTRIHREIRQGKMKTLLVMRHAKSSWADSGQSDFDRPLNPRGIKDAPRMGNHLREQGLIPDLVLHSSALRASETARATARSAQCDASPVAVEDLYLAAPQAYLDLLHGQDDANATIMVIGHNPGIADLVEQLTGQPDAMPTAAIAHIQLAIDSWADLATNSSASLVALWRPRDLPA